MLWIQPWSWAWTTGPRGPRRVVVDRSRLGDPHRRRAWVATTPWFMQPARFGGPRARIEQGRERAMTTQALWIGIDVAKDKLDVACGSQGALRSLANESKPLEAFASELETMG